MAPGMNMAGLHVPVNRLWVCVFSGTLIGIWYARRMSKVRLWLAYHAAIFGGLFAAMVIAEAIAEGAAIVAYFPWMFAAVGIPIWFMYRWATAYNKEHWGHASHKDCMKSDAGHESDAGTAF